MAPIATPTWKPISATTCGSGTFSSTARVARQDISNGAQWYFADHLGSSRVVWSTSGADISDYYPFGGERVISTGPNNHYKFTGKERDAESGLDNFGARYNSSTMARWMSPDVLNLTDARVQNPTNMLNKYLYGANNPLKYIDPDGQDAVALYEPPNGVSAGHFMLFVYNQDTGASAMMSYGPVDSSPAGLAMTATGGPVPATQTFGWPQTADQLRDNAAALSIRTTPEEAQEIINAIKSFSPSSTDYKLYSRNCSTVCRDLLKEVGLLPQNSRSITPAGLWDNIFARYARYNPFYDWLLKNGFTPHGKGNDYGNPRFGMNTFDFVMQSLSRPCVTILVPDGMGGSKPMTTCD
jgi:RHS repeat-associated protein